MSKTKHDFITDFLFDVNGQFHQPDYDMLDSFYDLMQKECEEKLRWIPVEEKLPEIGQRVLLKNEFYEYVGFLSKNKKDFRALTVEISHSNEKINGITHWRFL